MNDTVTVLLTVKPRPDDLSIRINDVPAVIKEVADKLHVHRRMTAADKDGNVSLTILENGKTHKYVSRLVFGKCRRASPPSRVRAARFVDRLPAAPVSRQDRPALQSLHRGR